MTDNGESSAHMYVHHQADPCSQHTSSMQFSANVLGHLVTLFTDLTQFRQFLFASVSNQVSTMIADFCRVQKSVCYKLKYISKLSLSPDVILAGQSHITVYCVFLRWPAVLTLCRTTHHLARKSSSQRIIRKILFPTNLH